MNEAKGGKSRCEQRTMNNVMVHEYFLIRKVPCVFTAECLADEPEPGLINSLADQRTRQPKSS